MFSIRPYQKKDYLYLQEICRGNLWQKVSLEKNVIKSALYCDYYLEQEPEFCFVAVDENDIPVGYIAAAANLDLYEEKMRNYYLPLVRKLSGTEYFGFSAEMKLTQRFIKNGYTAGIQVFLKNWTNDENNNVFDIYSSLVLALLEKLKASFVEGVYFVCPKNIPLLEKVYRHCGFEDIDYAANQIIFGIKLFSEDEE